MPETYKPIAQLAPSATTLTTLYTVAAATRAIISSLLVCNRSAVPVTFRVAISPLGAAIANAHYLYYDLTIPANDTFAAVLGLTLQPTDVVRAYAGTADLSFHLYGVEIT